jgi:hypothetical protein
MLLIPLMLFREDFFKPTRLVSRNPFISQRGLMPDNELLGATVTPKRAHFSQTGGFLSGLPLLYCQCIHFVNYKFGGLRMSLLDRASYSRECVIGIRSDEPNGANHKNQDHC